MSTVLLTPTDRLARALREDQSLTRQAAGEVVWEAPAIASFSRWLTDLWTGSWPDELLLSATQELVLWRDAIAADAAGQVLMSPLAAAREARLADQLVRRYAIDLNRAPSWREEHQAFRRWRAVVQARMRREGWITAGDLPSVVADLVRKGCLPLPRRIETLGLDYRLPASERQLFEALAEAGCAIESRPAAAAGADPQCLRYSDAESQFRAIALDLRERLRSCADHRMAPPRLVLALPDPDARRDLIESLFRPLLAPWLLRADSGARALPWRWERGRPLAEQPWIDVALAIVELAPAGNAPATISRLLLSPVLWNPAQRRLTADADQRLRDSGLPRLRLALVVEALQELVKAPLQRLAGLVASAPRRALPSEWTQHWRDRLAAIGWPGAAPDSVAFQAAGEWQRTLTRFSSMDGPLGLVAAGEALQWLKEFARGLRLEPRVEHLQPILIMSCEDAVGLPCERLYLADMGSSSFPGAARPSPFLAPELQIAAGLPGASPALQLEQSRDMVQRLLRMAPQVRVSMALVDERGAHSQPSPLFGPESGWSNAGAAPLAGRIELDAAAGPRLLLSEADPVPAVDPPEQAGLRIDAAMFRLWHESPFFAFCQYRLGIQPLARPGRGLDARGQGTLSHRVLQQIWTDLRSSAALAACDEAALRAQVAAALDRFMPAAMPAVDYGREQVRLERERQLDVLAQWLAHERRRVDPFEVVLMEQPAEIAVAGLNLKLRLDRVDRVASPWGPRWLVLDYKTGREADPRGWDSDRLKEPQLPLYASYAVSAAAGLPQVDGICFAHVKDGHPALSAATNWRDKMIDAASDRYIQDWQGQLSLWRDALERAARDFLAGVAGVKADVPSNSPYAGLLWLAAGGAAE